MNCRLKDVDLNLRLSAKIDTERGESEKLAREPGLTAHEGIVKLLITLDTHSHSSSLNRRGLGGTEKGSRREKQRHKLAFTLAKCKFFMCGIKFMKEKRKREMKDSKRRRQ